MIVSKRKSAAGERKTRHRWTIRACPRFPGLRRRGIPPAAIRQFVIGTASFLAPIISTIQGA